MTGQQNGILWRIARLHPGWVTLIVWVGYWFHVLSVEVFQGIPIASAAAFTVFLCFHFGYLLFVLFFVSGRFRSRSQVKAVRALSAICAVEVLAVSAIFAGPDSLQTLIDAGNSGDAVANMALTAAFLTLFVALLYLIAAPALALVDAEFGGSARTWRKIAALLQFFYLPFCVYFIHRRIRRLVTQEGRPDPIVYELPRERLALETMKSGHLCLELTERVGWEDFARYGEELLHRLDGRVVAKGSISDMHLWHVEIETLPLNLVYEDFPNRIRLESDSHAGDMLLRNLQERLASRSAY